MDVFICGVCREEFNDIAQFMEHKSQGSYSCGDCGVTYHTEKEVSDHVVEIHHGTAISSEAEDPEFVGGSTVEVQVVQTDSAEEPNSSIVLQADSNEEGGFTNITLLPDGHGNLTVVKKVVNHIQSNPTVAENGSGVQDVNDKTIYAFHNQHVDEIPTTVYTYCTEDREYYLSQSYDTEDRNDENQNSTVSVQVFNAGNNIDGIYACKLCQCFAMSKEEISKHLTIAHETVMESGITEAAQYISRLEPIRSTRTPNSEDVEPPNHCDLPTVQNNKDNIKLVPLDRDPLSKTTTVHLYVDSSPETENAQKENAAILPKRKVGRPKKTDQKKVSDEEQAAKVAKLEEEKATKVQKGSDGLYHCDKCSRAFTKERHLTSHKCFSASDYVPLNNKEISNLEDMPADDLEEEEDADRTADFRLSVPFGKAPWSRRGRGRRMRRGLLGRLIQLNSGKGHLGGNLLKLSAKDNLQTPWSLRGRRRRRGLLKRLIELNNGSSHVEANMLEPSGKDHLETTSKDFEGDGENGSFVTLEKNSSASACKPKLNWRNDPDHVSIFSTEEEKLFFEEHLNAVDLSCVDHLHCKHEVAQDINMTMATKISGKECQDLVVYSCIVCKKVFKSLSHTRLHCLIHTDLKPFRCTECDYASNAKGNVYTHMRKHTGNYFKCPSCEFRTCNRSHLAEHEAIHSNIRHQCKICLNDYNTVKSLVNHIRRYHVGPSGKEYLSTFMSKMPMSMATLHLCHICNKKFKKKIDRDRHLFHHNIKTNPDIIQCSLCSYIAARRSYLENHHRKHRLVYVCCICESVFLSSIKLRHHLCEHSRYNNNESQTEKITIFEAENETNGHCREALHNSVEKSETENPSSPNIESLFDESISSSWYLPEPDGTIALNQYVYIPEELLESQKSDKEDSQLGDNNSRNDEEVIMEGIPTEEKDMEFCEEKRLPEALSSISLNYKPLTLDLFAKIRNTFGNRECEVCGRLFHSRLDFESHILIHTVNKPFKCEKCHYCAATKDNLKRHQETSHEGRKFSCSDCDFVATSKTSLWHHKQKHIIADAFCEICKVNLTNMRTLREHIASKHPEVDKSVILKLLGTSQQRVIGRLGRPTHKCPYCDRVFHRSSTDLQKHIWIHEGVKPYKCPQCSHTCRSKNNLNVHMQKHSTEKPYICKECGKAYKSQTALRAHVKLHAQGAVFACDLCDFTAVQQIHLKKHRETHAMKYSCQYCAYSSNNVASMKYHYSRKHKESTFNETALINNQVIVEATGQTFRCLSCNCSFGNFLSIQTHLKELHQVTVEATDLAEPTDGSTSNALEGLEEQTSFEGQDQTESERTGEEQVPNEGEVQEAHVEGCYAEEMDEKTASAVNLIQQIIEQGALTSGATLHTDEGAVVTVNPQTVVLEGGQEFLVDGTAASGDYIIQYVTTAEGDECEFVLQADENSTTSYIVADENFERTAAATVETEN